MENINCLFFENGCLLDYFDGKPLQINCLYCIKGGYNTLEKKEENDKKKEELKSKTVSNTFERKPCCGSKITPFST